MLCSQNVLFSDVVCIEYLEQRCYFSGAQMMYLLDKSTQEKAISLATTLSSEIQGISLKVSSCYAYVVQSRYRVSCSYHM